MNSSKAHPEKKDGTVSNEEIERFCELLYNKIMLDIEKHGLQTLLKKAKLQN